MPTSESIEKVTKELNRLRSEVVEFDKRVKDLRESIRGIEWELLTHVGQSPAFQEDRLATRIADEVSSRLAVATNESNREPHTVRQGEGGCQVYWGDCFYSAKLAEQTGRRTDLPSHGLDAW